MGIQNEQGYLQHEETISMKFFLLFDTKIFSFGPHFPPKKKSVELQALSILVLKSIEREKN